MGPIVKQAKTDYTGKPVEFVTFDFTSEETTKQAKSDAEKFGVAKIYAENEKQTGFALLVDASSGQIVGRLTPGDDINAWHAAIDKALAGS